MQPINEYEVWFVTGSQELYGKQTLKQVADHSQRIVSGLQDSHHIPAKMVYKPTLTSADMILKLCREANSNENCIGLITWMHTFSPAKMWIAGLKELQKPFVHLHTQYNRDIPWSDIDMDFMNLNQAAHGGREFGHICTRLGKPRKVLVGHWLDDAVQAELDTWVRVAYAWSDSQHGKIARFGDNMRDVAVTEGDKVEAQIRFGYSVSGYGMGDLVRVVDQVSPADIDRLLTDYHDIYTITADLEPGGSVYGNLREAARIELGLRYFLEEGAFTAFTTTFENLHGLRQLPGLAVQRLMADGYGFGAEGDWKTAALVRTIKCMSQDLPGGSSFMEDYTYHLDPEGMLVLGAHMLEICPSIAENQPEIQVHPLAIGGKEDPARLVFQAATGAALNASLIDLGDRFRLIVNEVDVVDPPEPMPNLPVAQVLWNPQPDLQTAAQAWILAGGAHHTCFSQSITTKFLADLCDIAGIEMLVIDAQTDIRTFKRELLVNKRAYD